MTLTPDCPDSIRRALLRGSTILVLGCLALPVGRAVAAERMLPLRIVRRKIDGPATVRVKVGDQVDLRWTTDEATTIHIHGYDLALALDPTTEGRMRFLANATGRFPISAHGFGAGGDKTAHREVVLLYLEVLPD